jgi:hypothetical protein
MRPSTLTTSYRYSLAFVVAATFALVAGLSFPCNATNLRGQVRTIGPGGSVPMPEALVELFPLGYSGPPTFTTTTGSDGIYYFQNVNPGTYQIWINRKLGAGQVLVYPIPNEDIAPINMSPVYPPGF